MYVRMYISASDLIMMVTCYEREGGESEGGRGESEGERGRGESEGERGREGGRE